MSESSLAFNSSERLISTYYFYWYDIYSGLHVVDPDGTDALTNHPPDEYLSSFSHKDIVWHKRELLDMIDVGIDMILPVYWGSDQEKYWSKPGLNTLVEAERDLISDGYKPPKIGMFFDTTSLIQKNNNQPIDLTTGNGKAIFYQMIKDFYDAIPSEFWAEIDGKPIVWLYVSNYAYAYDQETFNYVDNRFQSDFGKTLYIVRDATWKGVITENKYSFGAAQHGPLIFDVASIGPGFDDSAIPGRVPWFKDRENGQFYKNSWKDAIDSGRKIIVIETWNEFLEATEICESKEYGRQYLEITKDYVNRFKFWPNYTNDPLIWIDIGETPLQKGLRISTANWDGAWKIALKGGKESGFAASDTAPPSYYIYFDVNNDFVYANTTKIWIQVEYFDEGFDTFTLEYDSSNPLGGPFEGAYTTSDTVSLTNTKQWKIHTFYLPDAYFSERQNFGSDFRLFNNKDGINYFNRIWVYKNDPDRFPPPTPTADFMSSTTRIEPFDTVEFVDLSKGYINSWLWNFGDGEAATEQNPLHKFTTEGKYTIYLTVTGPRGSDITTKTNYVLVANESPIKSVVPTPAPKQLANGANVVSIYAGSDGITQLSEAVQAVMDFFSGTISGHELIEVVIAYFRGIITENDQKTTFQQSHDLEELSNHSEAIRENTFTTPRVAAFYYNRFATPAVDGYWRFWDAYNPYATYSPPLDISSDYYPLLGPYSVNDAHVIDQHLAWLESAKIGLIIVEWMGRNSFENHTFSLLFERAAKTKVKIAFIIEPYVGRSADTLVEDVRYIYDQYGSSPAFFRTTEKSRHSSNDKSKGIFFIWAADFQYVSNFYPSLQGPPADAKYWKPAIDAIHALPEGGIVLLNPPFPDWIDPGHFDGAYNYATPHLSNEFALLARALPPGAWYVPSVIPGEEASRIGYDHSVYYPRDDSAVYDFQWAQALQTGVEPKIITVTSFNEWGEGTQIEPVAVGMKSGKGYDYKNYGSLGPLGYLERTAMWTDTFLNMSWTPIGKMDEINVTLGVTNVENGLWQVDLPLLRYNQDGGTSVVVMGGRECRSFVEFPSGGSYMYFAVHNDFIYAAKTPVAITVEYNAKGKGAFWIEYDSTDPTPPFEGAYKPTKYVRVDAGGLWRNTTIVLPDAYFGNRQKFGLDFRIARSNDPGYNLCISRVTVKK
jgi:PKD repeat protein